MSHLKERKDKTCLNCYAQTVGRYCHVCGQENLEPKESFWHLVTHFVYDVTHFDGKFFLTLKYLLFKPGYLANEYLKGRRTGYLHPIRMYVFASAIFFIIFLSFIVKPGDIAVNLQEKKKDGIEAIKQSLQNSIDTTEDTAKIRVMTQAANVLSSIQPAAPAKPGPKNTGEKPGSYHYQGSDSGKAAALKPGDSANVRIGEDGKPDPDYNAGNKKDHYRLIINGNEVPGTRKKYDSIQQKLPPDKQDGWFTRMINRKGIEIEQKYHGNESEFIKNFWETFLHSIPKMMFISVPFVGLVLQLLYIRRRRQFFYVNHVIFIIYVYIAAFILLLAYFGFDALYTVSGFAPFQWLAVLVMVFIFVYLYLAMRNFYRQGYIKTFFKYFILLVVCAILSGLIVSVFALTSIMEV